MDEVFRAAVLQSQLRTQAEQRLGQRAWRLLSRFGKLMSGPLAGSYVSALSWQAQAALIDHLTCGETVDVHLMHKHAPGADDEASSLRWADGVLIMVFSDREETA